MKKYQIESELAQTVWQIIESAQKITLRAHLRPDPDSLGACAALAHVLIAHGKEVEVVYPTSTADTVPYSIPHLKAGTHTQKPDLIISCDASTDARVYHHDDFNTVPQIVIDHHVGNSMAATHRLVYEAASSTCEIIYTLLTMWQQKVTPEVANILLMGILTDTLTFKTPNTTPTTLRIAGELIELGADMAALNRAMIVHTNPAVLQLWGQLLSTCQYTADHNAVWTVCTQEMLRTFEVGEEAVSDFIAMLSQTIASDITIFFLELADGTSKASLRGKTADVRSIATQFGGGGHTLAAGVTSEMDIGELVQLVVKSLTTFA